MSIHKIAKAVTVPAISICMAAILLAGTTETSFGFQGGFPGANSGQPCTYSLELQSSVPARQQFIAERARVTGMNFANAGTVEDMYDNIQPASYSEPSVNIWGFETKTTEIVGDMDSFSAGCVSCHDGNTASSIEVNLKNDPFRSGSAYKSPKSNHPIGMQYSSYVGRGDFKQVMEGSNKMTFVNGKVSCLTCHNPLNPERGHLVMSDRGSALCLTCHDR